MGTNEVGPLGACSARLTCRGAVAGGGQGDTAALEDPVAEMSSWGPGRREGV